MQNLLILTHACQRPETARLATPATPATRATRATQIKSVGFPALVTQNDVLDLLQMSQKCDPSCASLLSHNLTDISQATHRACPDLTLACI